MTQRQCATSKPCRTAPLTDVPEELPVKVLAAVVQPSLLQQQLQQRDGLLRAVLIHLQSARADSQIISQ